MVKFVSIEDGHIAEPWTAEWFFANVNYYGYKLWVWLRTPKEVVR